MTLQYLLNTAQDTDFYEEEAEDYLADKGVKVPSMFRETIYKLAWANGWRPTEVNVSFKGKITEKPGKYKEFIKK